MKFNKHDILDCEYNLGIFEILECDQEDKNYLLKCMCVDFKSMINNDNFWFGGPGSIGWLAEKVVDYKFKINTSYKLKKLIGKI